MSKVPEKILVIDDSRVVRKVILGMLQKSNYTAIEAGDGEAGVELAKSEKPACILMDIIMPGIDGYETTRRLKADPATKGIPVIFMTATADQARDKVRGFEVGGVDYVMKPFETEELLARIKTHLKLNQMTQQMENYAIKLQQSHNKLEELVKERTEELTRANAQLVVRDLERQKMVQAIKFSEKRYKSVFENPSVAHVVTDKNNKLIQVNKGWCNMIGYSEEELLHDINETELTYEKDRTNADEYLHKMIDGEVEQVKTAKRYVHKSGKIVDCLVFIHALFDDSSKFVGTCGTMIDMSD